MYTFTKKWVNPDIHQKSQRKRINDARRKICPDSPFWPTNLDIESHKTAWYKLKQDTLLAQQSPTSETRQQDESSHTLPPTPVKPVFGGKLWLDNLAPVTASGPTVFTPEFETGRGGRELASWPSKAEMKYEGDERVATDRIHGRFLGLPRRNANDTTAWAQRGLLDQYVMDDFVFPAPGPVDVFMCGFRVEEMEITDEEGAHLLGVEMMGLLDPVNRL